VQPEKHTGAIPMRRDVMNGLLIARTRGIVRSQRIRDLRAGLRDDEGLTTAEYAVGTVAVAGLGGVLLKLLTSDLVRDLIWNVIQRAFTALLGG